MAPRGRGGKFSKPSRGGGKHYSRDIQPVDKDGNPVSLWREPDADIPTSDEEADDDDDDDDDDEEESDDNEGPAAAGSSTHFTHKESPLATEMTREERRAAAKAKKAAAAAKRNQVAAQPGDLPPSSSDPESDGDEDDDDLPANPNHTAKSRSQLHKPNAGGSADEGAESGQLSRREREALEAQQARERYLKLHAEGKTDEARADLARLALVRERREADRLRKEAEKEEKLELAKKRAAEREAKLAKTGKKGAKK